MSPKKKFSFVKTFVFTAVAFIIVLILIEAFFSLFSEAGFSGFLQNFNYPFVIKYAVAKLVGGIIYGLFMAFILQRRAKKMERK
jgi:membrane associated rhomboid family serine protease